MNTSGKCRLLAAGTLCGALFGGVAALSLALATEDDPSGQEVAEAASPDPRLVARGKRLYIFCQACHATEADSGEKIGPHLAGIVGRPVASIEGSAYSAALREQDFAWSDEKLDVWLQRPSTLVPGTTMAFVGIPKAETRAELIAYLKTL